MTLINMDKVKNVIKDEEIKTFFKDEKTIDMLSEMVVKSILENKEDAYILCGNKFRNLTGVKKTSDTAILIFSPKEIGKVCQGSREMAVHFHGPYLSNLSNEDKIGHNALFNFGIKFGCAVGVDGFSCQTPRRTFKIPWNKKFYEKLRKFHIPVWEDVDNIFCVSNKDKMKECTLSFTDDSPSWTNKFNVVIAEQHFSREPYLWYGTKSHMPDMKITLPSNQPQVCVTTLTNNNNRVLTCFAEIGE
jgi:hypothetical protein